MSAAQKNYLVYGFLAATWLLTIYQLSLEWSINAQYQYGWIVPVLTLMLWSSRWVARPEPGEPFLRPLLVPVVGLVAFLAIPLRILEEANPDWRLLNFVWASQAILLTALVLDRSGGRPWLQHFAFPLLFPLVAVPWPSGLELSVIQGMQRIVTETGVECSLWMGWDAVQEGNLIALPNGVVGINEACSGIRSLQSSLMISIFLGEYLELYLVRRLILVLLSVAVAFLLNLIRALILISLMANYGPSALAYYHDSTGMSISLGCLVLLWTIAHLLVKKHHSKLPTPMAVISAGLRFPAMACIMLLAAWAVAELANQAWFFISEEETVPAPLWTVTWPLARPHFEQVQIDEDTQTILHYDVGLHGKWVDQYQWELFFFIWHPGRATAGLAEGHHPSTCFPAAGFILEKDLGLKAMSIPGLTMPVNRYIFSAPHTTNLYYVFQCIMSDRVNPQNDLLVNIPYESVEGRFRSAWVGRRNLGQRSLLIVNQGAASQEEAEAATERLLAECIQF